MKDTALAAAGSLLRTRNFGGPESDQLSRDEEVWRTQSKMRNGGESGHYYHLEQEQLKPDRGDAVGDTVQCTSMWSRANAAAFQCSKDRHQEAGSGILETFTVRKISRRRVERTSQSL